MELGPIAKRNKKKPELKINKRNTQLLDLSSSLGSAGYPLAAGFLVHFSERAAQANRHNLIKTDYEFRPETKISIKVKRK
jgi:hypothetical protein